MNALIINGLYQEHPGFIISDKARSHKEEREEMSSPPEKPFKDRENSQHFFKVADWHRAFLITYPLGFGYFPIGVAFGLVAVSAGFPWWVALLTSIFVYAGSSQFAFVEAVKMLSGEFAIAVQTFTINLRHIFYGLPLLKDFPKKPIAKYYCFFGLTDGVFSILTTMPPKERQKLMVKMTALCHFYWVLATIVGLLLGEGVADMIPHLDFALPAIFTIFWLDHLRQVRVWWPTLIAFVVFMLMVIIIPQSALIMAIMVSFFLVLFVFILKEKRVALNENYKDKERIIHSLKKEQDDH